MTNGQSVDFHGIVTASPEMIELFGRVELAARSDASVLLRGETGAGKELVARAIHRISERRAGPFKVVNCATFSPELLASELFGHVRGAFTGAVSDRPGLFKQAHGGTVFLDEVAETPLPLQAQLLRVVESKSFVPVGGSTSQTVDVRIVSATHRALRREVRDRRFRADLMYRLRVIPLFLPPLRQRQGDIEALATLFAQELGGKSAQDIERISPAAMALMRAYAWPGNVRELRNVIEYALVMGQGTQVEPEDLTPELRGEEPEDGDDVAPDHDTSDAAELRAALSKAGGSKTRAAELLGISRTTLWRKLREHRIDG